MMEVDAESAEEIARAKALDLYKNSRAKHFSSAKELEQSRESRILVPEPGDESFLYTHKNPKRHLMTKMIGSSYPMPHPNFKGLHEDKIDSIYMEKFLLMNTADKTPDVPGLKLSGAIPDRVPLIRSLETDMRCNKLGYQYPTQSCLDHILSSPSVDNRTDHSIQEIELLMSTDAHLHDFVAWAKSWQQVNEDGFPSGILSLDTESITIKTYDRDRIVNEHVKMRSGQDYLKVIESTLPGEDDETVPLVTRIIIGDGLTWSASINLPWYSHNGEEGRIDFHVCDLKINNPVLSFIRQARAWVGHGIVQDSMSLFEIMYYFYGIKPIFPPAVEIEALLALLGSGYPRSNMMTNHLLVTGTVLNKMVSCADNNWHYRLDHLPSSLHRYLLGDIKSGYICATVCLALLIRDLFPDPDVVCFTISKSQTDWIRYFCELVYHVVKDLTIQHDLRVAAKTRKDAILALGGASYENVSAGRMKENSMLGLFTKLLPPWPTVPYGGARNLHKVRFHFLTQYEVLSDIGYEHPRIAPVLNRHKGKLRNEFILDVTYGRTMSKEQLEGPVTAVNAPGLQSDTSFGPTLFWLDPKDLTFDRLAAEANRVNRDISVAIKEIVRIDPYLIQDVLGALLDVNLEDENMKYWKKTTVYERIRFTYFNIFDRQAFKVQAIESRIQAHNDNTLIETARGVPTEHHQMRLDYLNQLATQSRDNSGIRSSLHATAVAAKPALNRKERKRLARQFALSNKSRKSFKPQKPILPKTNDTPKKKVRLDLSLVNPSNDLRNKIRKRREETITSNHSTDQAETADRTPPETSQPSIYHAHELAMIPPIQISNNLAMSNINTSAMAPQFSCKDNTFFVPSGPSAALKGNTKTAEEKQRDEYFARFRDAAYDPMQNMKWEFDPPRYQQERQRRSGGLRSRKKKIPAAYQENLCLPVDPTDDEECEVVYESLDTTLQKHGLKPPKKNKRYK